MITTLKRSIAALTVAAAALFTLTACSMAYGDSSNVEPLVSQDFEDSEAVLAALEAASVITVKKDVISFGDRWTVFADGDEIGEIKGQPIYSLGDTYSLFSKAGNLVGSEGEGYRLINHSAKLYGYENELRGEIKERFSLFLTNYEIYDGAGALRGTAEQQFDLSMSFAVLGAGGAKEWQISKALFSLGASVEITAKSKDRSVKAIDALWVAVIGSEVDEAKRSEDNS